MKERNAWVKYPANPNDPVKYPATIKYVTIIDFVFQHAFISEINRNYDTQAEVLAVCIDKNTGRYSTESLYWLYDRKPAE